MRRIVVAIGLFMLPLRGSVNSELDGLKAEVMKMNDTWQRTCLNVAQTDRGKDLCREIHGIYAGMWKKGSR